jgi:soluble lytic murein transglycosylase
MSKTALILSFLLLFTSAAFSDIYKYIDENGVIYYTDAPSGKKAEIVRKDKKISDNKIINNRNYSKYVKKAAKKYQIEPELINAVIKTESNGNYKAISRKGAMGLMQLMPTTANEMDVRNPFNPEENIEGGTRYLRYLLEKFNGNLTLALAAYNSGPKTVEKYGSVPPISETRNYVNKVFTLYQGKRDYAVSVPDKQEKPTPIYKIVLEDGTILFTNLSHATTGKLRF